MVSVIRDHTSQGVSGCWVDWAAMAISWFWSACWVR